MELIFKDRVGIVADISALIARTWLEYCLHGGVSGRLTRPMSI